MNMRLMSGLAILALAGATGCDPGGGGNGGEVIEIPDPGPEPEMPDPEMPDPEMPDPEMPDPEMPDPEPELVCEGLALLGCGAHDTESVELTIIGTASDGLNVPRDLSFNPHVDGVELWVVNRADDSTSTFFDPGTAAQDSVHLIDPYALHFMEEVSSIEFGAPGTFGTCQESRNTYNGLGEPNDFMGPALWSSDFEVYARTNPDAVAFLGFDLGSHLDMLHESPLCMGIAWERDNVYWVFEGALGSISRNDFRQDHGPGYDDHSDGVITRFAVGEFSRVPDVPSHMVFEHETGFLYIADTGNKRVAMLDTNQGEPGARMFSVEPGTVLQMAADAAPVQTVFDSEELIRPSGLALKDKVLYIGDNANGRIWAVGEDGAVIDYLDTGMADGALMGIEIGPAGDLWAVDAVENQLIRISALPENAEAEAAARADAEDGE